MKKFSNVEDGVETHEIEETGDYTVHHPGWASDIEDKNYDPSQREDFDMVCENALNSVSRDQLTDEEWEEHKHWVIKNWEDLNA